MRTVKKGKLFKQLKSIGLGIGLTLAIGLVPSAAEAVVGGSADQLSTGGGDLNGHQVYFGNYTGGNANGDLKWHVVDTNSPDKEKQPAITLWTGETHLGNRQYNSTPDHKDWSGSDLCDWLNSTESGHFLEHFSDNENRAIAKYGEQETGPYETININQQVLIPSVEEVKTAGTWRLSSDAIRKFGQNSTDGYWLRSPGFDWSIAAVVRAYGGVYPLGYHVNVSLWVVRPALKIPLASILFTSSANSGSGAAKSEVGVSKQLTAITPVAGDLADTPLKLTVIDPEMAAPSIDNFSAVGNQIQFDYSGAVTKGNHFLSVLLTDASSSEVKYYGKLAATEKKGSGVASFSTGGLADGKYKVKLYNEQANGNKKTDVASVPVEKEVTIKNGLLEDSIGATIAFDGYEWYVIGSTETNGLRVLLKNPTNKKNDSSVPGNRPYVADTRFNPSGNNHYATSDLKPAMDKAYGLIENDREGALVQERRLEGGSANYGGSGYNANNVAGDSVKNAKFWPLSVWEAETLNDEIRRYSSYWWLRSPGYFRNNAAVVDSYGDVLPYGYSVDSNQWVVRPAFDLPLSSALFASSASAASGATNWTEVGTWEAQQNNPTTFTMIDPTAESDRLKLTVTSSDSLIIGNDSSEKVSITYTSATVNSGEGKGSYEKNTLSALLVDEEGNQQYLRVADLTKQEGTIEIPMPEGLSTGEYTLKVFNEEVNKALYTNLTSDPEEIRLTVKQRAKGVTVEPNNRSNVKIPVKEGTELAITFDQPMSTDAIGTIKLTHSTDKELQASFKEWKEGSANKTAIYTVQGLTYNTDYTYEFSGFEDAQGVAVNDYGDSDEKWTFTTYAQEKQPQIKIDYAKERLTDFDGTNYTLTDLADYEIQQEDGKFYVALANEQLDKTITIVKKGTAGDSHDSSAQTLTIPARPAAPASNLFTVTPASDASTSDGAITGITSDMEYQLTTDDTWQAGTGNVLGSLSATDNVSIRYKATGEAFVSAARKIPLTARPVVMAISPATQLPESGTVTLRFTKELTQAGTLTLVNKEKPDDTHTLTNVTMDQEDKTKVTADYTGLNGGTTYQVVLDTGFVDTDQNNLDPNHKDNTKEVSTAPKFTITNTEPMDGAIVDIAQGTLTITFSEAVNDQVAGTVTLSEEGALSLSEWAAPNQAVFTIDSSLAYGKTYTYEVSGFQSKQGITMAGTSGHFKVVAKEEQPAITLDYQDEVLAGFDTDAHYRLTIGEMTDDDWVGESTRAILDTEHGKAVTIIRKGTKGISVDSEPVTFTLPERTAAPEVTMEPETKTGENDGKMRANATAQVECEQSEGNWESYDEPALNSLTAGTTIRFRTSYTTDQPGKLGSGKFRSQAVEKTMVSRPSIVSTTPRTDAPVTGELVLAFDRAMTTDLMAAGTVQIALAGVEPPNWTTLSASKKPWSDDGKQYTVAYEDLQDGQTYQLKITGFKDSLYPMAEETSNTLTIAPKPTIEAVRPSGGANVPIETEIVEIDFNVPMATEGKVVLTNKNKKAITGEFAGWKDDSENKTAIYAIDGLTYGQNYRYTISEFVSQKGTQLKENQDYSLTTIGKETPPHLTLNYVDETLLGFDKNAKYQIVGEELLEETETLSVSDRITTSDTPLAIVKRGNAGESVDSDPVTVVLPARPAAPSGLTIEPASDEQTADGEITGVDDTMEYSTDNGTNWTTVTKNKIDKRSKEDRILVRVAATNEEKRFRSEATVVTMVDRPAVVGVETAPNAPTSGSLAITFSREMAEDQGTVMLGEDTLASGTWNEERTVYTVNYTDLQESTEYQVTILGFEDKDGYKMTETTDFTVTIGDHQAPIVEQVTPSGAAVSLTTSHLTIRFNEAVKADIGTVTAEGLTLTNPRFTEEGNKVVTYDLAGLERNKTYSLKVSGFTDTAGNVLTEEYVHKFSTENSTYTIEYINGAEDATGNMSPQPMTYGSKTKLAANTYQRIGYTFAGWKDGDDTSYTDGQEVANLTETHEATLTLTAQWTANKYQASFDSNQGTGTIDEQTVEYGGSCPLPTEGFTREGYRLIGWSTSATAGVGTVYSLGDVIDSWLFTSDTTFYAVWQVEYTLRFNPDNGEAISEQKVLAGGLAILPTNPVKAYHSFGGWLFNGSLYTVDLPVTQNMELIARWQKVYHTVAFDANGGAGSTKRTMMSGTTVTEPDVFYYGHRLVGWSTTRNGGALWDVASPITEDVTLYAQWEAIPSYTLSFNSNGGQAIGAVTEVEDTTIDLSQYCPTREGHLFGGWFSDVELTIPVTQVTLRADTTVHAKWQEVTETARYTLSFNSNGGSRVPEVVSDKDTVVPLSNKPTRKGYTFDGWYDNAGLGGPAITSVTMTQNHVVHAKWTANTYQVTIDPAGGAGNTAPLTATYDERFGFPASDTYTKAGNQLIGWQIGTTRYQAGLTLPQWPYDQNQTIKAIWVTNTYEIQFDSREGTAVAPQHIAHGERLIEPTPPSRTGYTFTGWYLTDDASGRPVDFESYKATEEMTFYAGWQSDTFFNVRFESRDKHEIESIQVRGGEKAPVPDSWDWPGYTFGGWYDENGYSISQVLVSNNTTFMAKWLPISYTATLRNPAAAKDKDKEIKLSYDRDNLQALPVPERRGYTFAGWQEVSRTRALGEIHHDMTRLFGNVVLEATWGMNNYHVIFDTAGGNNLDPLVFTIEEAVDELPTPSRTGYLFKGWVDQEGKEVHRIAENTVGDQTLIARWQVDKTKLADLVVKEQEQHRTANRYTLTSWKTYEAALTKAQNILNKKDATPQEVDEAFAGLEAAIKQLADRSTVVQPVDTTKTPNQIVSPGKQYDTTTTAPQSKKATSLLQTGEEQSVLYLIMGFLLVGLVIPAWKKWQDLTK